MTRPTRRQRRSIRLPGCDYAQPGAYFVTVCTKDRKSLFGDVIEGEIELNRYGQIARDEWLRTGAIRAEVDLDTFVVMPDHIHGIVHISGQASRGPVSTVGAHGRAPLRLRRLPRSLGSLIAGYKSSVTKKIDRIRSTPGAHVWQRNYYERVIRNEEELNQVRQYVFDNPTRWADDPENPDTGRTQSAAGHPVGAAREPPLPAHVNLPNN